MAKHEVHCEDCNVILGNEFSHIHRWLDQYKKDFPIRPFLAYHRSFLHNSYGLKIVKEKWGGREEDAAKIHLIRDFEDALNENIDYLRFNEIDRLLAKILPICNQMTNMEPEPHQLIWKRMKDENIGLMALMEEG